MSQHPPAFDYSQLDAYEQHRAYQRAWKKFRAWVQEKKKLGRPVPRWPDVLAAEQARELKRRNRNTNPD